MSTNTSEQVMDESIEQVEQVESVEQTVEQVTVVEQVGADGRALLPGQLAGETRSAMIRRLTVEGLTKGQIHKLTGLRYQHVYNVLSQETVERPRCDKCGQTVKS